MAGPVFIGYVSHEDGLEKLTRSTQNKLDTGNGLGSICRQRDIVISHYQPSDLSIQL